MIDNDKYISRQEIALRLGVSKESVKQQCIKGAIKSPVIQYKRFMYYDRKIAEEWMIKFADNKRHTNAKREKTGNYDVWGVRANKKRFVYSGKTLMHILFCQPALRNGRYSYQDCKE